MDKFIFSYVDKDREGIFKDLTANEAKSTVDFLPSHKVFNSLFMNKIEKVCLSYKLNLKVELPFKRLFYNLDSYDYKIGNTYHIILPTTSISKLSVKYLYDLKKNHSNIKLYALVTDSMHASSPHMNFVRDKLFSNAFDAVLTYDKYDAAEYGFEWFGYTYYSSFDSIRPDDQVSDLYYVGYDKGNRNDTLIDIYRTIENGGDSAI